MKSLIERPRLQIILAILAVISLIYGYGSGEAAIVLKKAGRICLECIGLG